MISERDLRQRLSVLADTAPGAGACILSGDPLVTVTGRRIAGRSDPVVSGDAWHIGSCTKAMTATLLARLRARGLVDFGAPLGDHLPGLAMHPAFAATPLRAFLSHDAGIRRDPHWSVFARLRGSRATIMEQRRHVSALALVDAPVAKAGYSNLGYIVLGTVVETVTGRPWEQVFRDEVLGPLGMAGAGFGAPPLPGTTGHTERGGRWHPKPPGPYADNPRVYGPAGGVHLPLHDWARFAALHLGEGPEGFLPEPLLAELQDRSASGYAAGWGTGTLADGARLLRHTGTNTMWFADIRLAPAHGFGVMVVCNAYSPPLHQRILSFTDALFTDAFQTSADGIALRPNR
jgi:CubicO group peptidase (beta-lactamase class C family)